MIVEDGGVLRKKSSVRGTDVEIRDQTIGVDSVGVVYEVAVVSSSSCITVASS